MVTIGKFLFCLCVALRTPSVRAMNLATRSPKPGCGPLSMVSAKNAHAIATDMGMIPGAGTNPGAILPFTNSYMDGFFMVGCIKDDMHAHGDKFGDGKYSYNLGSVSNVSIVHYSELVPKEDSEAMTHEVCFAFCRTVPNMGFFGLIHGRDCYCTPYYNQVAGDSSECDAVCEGDPSTMCGGMAKSSIFEMHSCDDAVANLETAKSSAEAQRMKLVSALAGIETVATSMQDAAATLQKSFGNVGDSAATALFQEAKVFAGKLHEYAADGTKLASKMEGLETDAASLQGADESKESVTAALKAATASAKKSVDELTELEATATEPEAGLNVSAALYYPAMYFVDKDFANVPSTCGGQPAAKPLIGSYDGCAAACEAAVGTCVGFSYFGKGQLCFLLSALETVTYYTGCGSSAFLDLRDKITSADDTKCAVKFSKFDGKSIKPDASGKCDGCLKKASKADRCFK